MRKVAVCVETASEAMKSNLVLAEGGQVRRFSPLLAKELAVPVIEQGQTPTCSKIASLMTIKYYYPDLNIDEEWLSGVNELLSSRLQELLDAEFCKNLAEFRKRHKDVLEGLRLSRFERLKEQILAGNPVPNLHSDFCGYLHSVVVTGFGSDGSVVFNSWGARRVFSKQEFEKE